MLDKLKALWAVFQTGQTVVDKQKWRGHQISANAIAAFLFALVQLGKAWGYDFGIDMQACADISIGLLALANVGFTVATSSAHGLPATPVRDAESPVPSAEQTAESNTEVATDETVPSVRVADVQPTSIDDDTRARAIAWAREHSATNGLQNDA